MTKGVFTARPGSSYDDLVEFRYHFPGTYLNYARQMVGDWIVYYEPRRNGGREVYFATAQVVGIEPDPKREDHFYAQVTGYLDFDQPVPWRIDSQRAFESGLTKAGGSTNKGAFGRAVRRLDGGEYRAILAAGFPISGVGEQAYYRGRGGLYMPDDGVAEVSHDDTREIVESLVRRPFRDQAFRHAVRHAYQDTCAFTGLIIRNGGGRPEVQAAHIQAVEDRGPDSLRNGLALSGTIHWMFDRGLLAVGDDYEILTHEHKVPEAVQRMLNPDGRIRLPKREEERPLMQFVQFHRRERFERAG